MEAASRHRRTKSAAAIEGNLQRSQRHRSVPAHSSFNSSIPTGNLLQKQNSSKQGCGTPIKKLLAQEMVKENETRKKQPSVIARLMGLDGMPSPQPSLKQQRKFLAKNVKQTPSADLSQKEQCFQVQPSKIDSMDQQDFKDVYEDMEASHVMNHRCSSRWTANSRLLKPETGHLQQKKCHNGTLSIIDSSNELLLKYLEHPDVLFLKHYYTLQDDPSSSPYDYISSFEPSNSVKHQGYSKVQNLTRDGVYRRDNTRKKRVDGLLLQSHNHQSSRNCWQAPNQANVKDDINAPTTRIVVLKPNIGKRMNAACVSSPESSHASAPTIRKRLQYPGSGTGDTLLCRKRNSSRKAYSSKSTSRECTDVSKESTRKTIKHLKSSIGLRGYAGDDSSYDAGESDSSSASEMMIMSSKNSFDGNDWVMRSSSGPFESVVSKEARKRLSERWRMAYKSKSSEPTAKVSTLEEMLAVPERDNVQLQLDVGTTLDEPSERFLGNINTSGWDGPRGISSRDGWKEGYIRTSSRSRSLPPSIGNRNCKTSGMRETDAGDRVTKEKDTVKIKSRKGKIRKDGDISEKDDILSNFESDPCLDKFVDNSGSSRDVSSCQIQTDVNFYRGVKHESIFMHTQSPCLMDSSGCLVTDLAKNAEPEPLPLSSDPFTDLCSKHDDPFVSPDGSSALNQDVALEESVMVKSEAKSASFESCGLDQESYESSKEADHCSPVSVLEVSFSEDVSGSPDSFETVNAKIKQLRNELQLLKMESGGCTDHMLLSNNLDTMQHQLGRIFEEEQIVGDDTWESSYVDDMLLFSGLEDFDPNTLNIASWHSPECPIGPWVFNSLEKKYTDERTELKFERRLLFDLVNSALHEMFLQYVSRSSSLHPLIIVVPKWQRHGIREHLQEMLFHQENMVNKEKREILLDREMNWLGFRDSVETIGEDIEKLLIDDLIGELLTV